MKINHRHGKRSRQTNLDFWMIMEIMRVFREEEQRRVTSSDIGKALRILHRRNPIDQDHVIRVQKALAQMKRNRFHSIGQASLILDRLQEMHDDVANIVHRREKFLFLSADGKNIHEGDTTFYVNSYLHIVPTQAPAKPKSTVKHFSCKAAAEAFVFKSRLNIQSATSKFGI